MFVPLHFPEEAVRTTSCLAAPEIVGLAVFTGGAAATAGRPSISLSNTAFADAGAYSPFTCETMYLPMSSGVSV